MTPWRPAPSTRSRARLLAGVLAGALLLSGCAAQESLVGLHPAPVEKTAAAPLDVEGATAVAARLLAQADAAAKETDPEVAKKARSAVLMGDALTLANAEAARAPATSTTAELAAEPKPTVVAQSAGRAWPRAILAATLDEESNTQFLHVMLSEKPEEPFRIAATVPMFGGATLPALGDSSAGAPLLDARAKDGLALSPEDAVTAYAAALAHPKPKASDAVSVEDPFATRLKAATAAQAKALGKLGSLAQAHAPLLGDAVTFRLADGGAVTFGLLRRTDTIAVKKTAKELVLPAEYAKVIGKKKVTKSLSLQNLEPFVMVVPRTGAAEVIGASELLVSGKGR
jgi:hypothetical protein